MHYKKLIKTVCLNTALLFLEMHKHITHNGDCNMIIDGITATVDVKVTLSSLQVQ